jgi:hypothetical protein
MKVKMLMALALTSLASATITFAAPTLQKADDAPSMGSDPAMQTPAPDSNPTSNTPNVGSSMPDNNTPSTGPSAGNDDMSADTATGDDDY